MKIGSAGALIGRIKFFSGVLLRFNNVFGLRGIFLMLKLYGKYLQKNDTPVTVKLDASRSIEVRPVTDLGVFNQVFIDKEYDLPLDLPINTILDCGANVGYATVYLAHRYPEANIVSIEPLNQTFEMLRKNTDSLGCATPVLGAVWRESAELEISDPTAPSVGIQVGESSNETNANKVKAYTVQQLTELSGNSTVDLLKLDIEGAEFEVFQRPEFLELVRYIAIEFHNQIKPGSEQAIRKTLTERGFLETSVVGENVIFCRAAA